MQPFATKRMSIPVTDHHAAPETSARRRVLFVHADPGLRDVVTRALEGEGYRVHAVAHSGHALLLCRSTTFDVVIAELSGPDVSGPTLVEQLRRHCPRVSTVYLGHPGTPEGVDHVLVRPFTCDDLVDRIELALSGVAA